MRAVGVWGARAGNAVVADLFAGTGNLGLEALSRGAASAVFVDNSPGSMSLLKENVSRAKLNERAEFYKADVTSALNKFAVHNRLFHLIFCDPPYNRGFVALVLHRLDQANLLYPGGIIVLEHSKHEVIPTDLSRLQLKRTERYGETLVSFLINDVE